MPVETAFGIYRTVEERLPAFLKKYPPHEGFGVQVYINDLLSFKPGLKQLYLEAIRSGRDLSDCGLPRLPEPNGFLIECRLVRGDKILGSAFHYVELGLEHDLETGEKKARNRLLDSLGFFGNPSDSIYPAQPTVSDGFDLPSSDTDLGEAPEPDSPVSDNVSRISVIGSPLNDALQQQCDRHIARLTEAGVSVSPPTNKEDALAVLRTPLPTSDDTDGESEAS